uniref:CCHC-type domain-containing protein n=1 Tax=Leptobrachium leishanense TaxID=445787 RepID=A0A8C5PY50_9ANUR
MESIFKEVAKVQHTAAIVQAMQGSIDPWWEAKNCVANLIGNGKFRKRKGKYALIFAAGWMADKFQESCRLKLSLEGEMEDLKVEMDKLRALVVQQADEASTDYECTVRSNTELCKENECLSESSTHAQEAVRELSGPCSRTEAERCAVSMEKSEDFGSDTETDSGMEMDNLSDPGVGNVGAMAEDTSGESVVKVLHSDSGVGSSHARMASVGQQGRSPCAQRRFCAGRQAIRCFACGGFSHIARNCVVTNGNRQRDSKYPRTTARSKAVYSARWGNGPRHGSLQRHRRQGQPRSWIQETDLKSQYERLKCENVKLREERDRLWEFSRVPNFGFQKRGNEEMLLRSF